MRNNQETKMNYWLRIFKRSELIFWLDMLFFYLSISFLSCDT